MPGFRRDRAVLVAVFLTAFSVCAPGTALAAPGTGGTAIPEVLPQASGGMGYGDPGTFSLVVKPIAVLHRHLVARGTMPGAQRRRVILQRFDRKHGLAQRRAHARALDGSLQGQVEGRPDGPHQPARDPRRPPRRARLEQRQRQRRSADRQGDGLPRREGDVLRPRLLRPADGLRPDAHARHARRRAQEAAVRHARRRHLRRPRDRRAGHRPRPVQRQLRVGPHAGHGRRARLHQHRRGRDRLRARRSQPART